VDRAYVISVVNDTTAVTTTCGVRDNERRTSRVYDYGDTYCSGTNFVAGVPPPPPLYRTARLRRTGTCPTIAIDSVERETFFYDGPSP